MPDCNHEEADTRIVVHVLHVLQQRMKKIEICTVDTDVIIILMGAFHKLVKIQPVADIWVAFGMGKSYRFLSINAIFDSLGKQKAQALPLFHALTGSDTTSAFKGKGKKSAWQAWQAFAEVTDTFVYCSLHPFESLSVDSIHFKAIERFVVVLYDRTSPLISVNDTREELFCKINRSIERIPPTQDALLQHTKQTVYQAGIWTSTQTQQVLP